MICFYKSVVLNWWVIQGPTSTFITPLSVTACGSMGPKANPVEIHCTKLHYNQALRTSFHTNKLELKGIAQPKMKMLSFMPFQANIFFCGNTKGHVKKKQESYALLLQFCCSIISPSSLVVWKRTSFVFYRRKTWVHDDKPFFIF